MVIYRGVRGRIAEQGTNPIVIGAWVKVGDEVSERARPTTAWAA